ncbi:Ku protein [Amycolatopsis nigrescens]|uniref:non-homologous end joining protein Ku n=1 Tax=Amycolatopsis nigrescens TaxID=381445 RepID=UPI000378D7BB|nr:Ku protein [Amycolatopsis nigrescens]
MRTVWKGTIGFGSYAIPVKAYSAVEEQGVSLHLLHESDGGRIRHRRVCEACGDQVAEVPMTELAKGYQMPGGDVVVLTDEDFATLPLPTAHSIEVCAFAPLEQIDPIYFARTYFLEPEVVGTKPYVLLSEALQQAGLVAVVKVALRQRETLGTLRVRDQVIVLETMHWPDEIRTPDFPFLYEDVDMRLSELRTAVTMIERLAGDFEPQQYADGYRTALEALIQAKADGNEVVQPTAERQNAGVTDLLAALQASVRRQDEEPAHEEEPVHKAKVAERKAAQAKDTAKKAASEPRATAGPKAE